MTAGNAIGTTYDGATPLLNASTPVTSGPHTGQDLPGSRSCDAGTRRAVCEADVVEEDRRVIDVVALVEDGQVQAGLYRLAVKRKLTRLRVKVIFTSDSGQRVVKTKNIKLKLQR